jgi:hypothetical protein
MRQPDSTHTGGVDAVAGELSERVQDPVNLPLKIFGCHGLFLFSNGSRSPPRAEAQTTSIVSGGGRVHASKIHKIGKKIPKKSIHPCTTEADAPPHSFLPLNTRVRLPAHRVWCRGRALTSSDLDDAQRQQGK